MGNAKRNMQSAKLEWEEGGGSRGDWHESECFAFKILRFAFKILRFEFKILRFAQDDTNEQECER